MMQQIDHQNRYINEMAVIKSDIFYKSAISNDESGE